MKLYVWENDGAERPGEIRIVQQGGVNGDVIERYAAQGKTARGFKEHPFKDEKLPIGAIFWDGKRVARRPQLKARLEKTTVRVGEVAKIIGVPSGAFVIVADGLNSERYGPTTGQIVQMTMEDRGRRTISIEAFPHLPQTLHLNVE